MAKRAPSKHSRAARRATSPSIDTDKSLKNAKPPPESVDHRPAILGLHNSAGVHKSKRGRKAVLSFKAKRRQGKDLERAEAVMEKTWQRVQRSKGSARSLQMRRKTWGEVNSAHAGKTAGPTTKKKDDLEQDAVDAFFDTDEEMDEAQDSEVQDGGEPKGETSVIPAVAPMMVPLPEPTEDEDEIL